MISLLPSKIAALVSATVVAAITLSPSAAQATTHCPSGEYGFACIFEDHGFGGKEIQTESSNDNWDYGLTGAFNYMNDKMSSVADNTAHTYTYVHEDKNYKGYHYCVKPGTEISNVNNNIDDKSSSHNFKSSCSY